MRKPFDTEPRIVALTESALTEQQVPSSWIPETSTVRVALDPARWSRRSREASYWRMVQILNQTRLH
ncbi:MAG: hypothetical protein ACJ8OJ_07095 [Povalibacter sp.]